MAAAVTAIPAAKVVVVFMVFSIGCRPWRILNESLAREISRFGQ
jgi:hypothetical protein